MVSGDRSSGLDKVRDPGMKREISLLKADLYPLALKQFFVLKNALAVRRRGRGRASYTDAPDWGLQAW